jgi:beta-xylosidase
MKYLIVIIISIISYSCSNSKQFLYKNPITKGLQKGGLRDCQISRDGNKWYMTGTCYPVWKGENPGVILYSSDDLLNWSVEKYLIERSSLDSTVWYYDRFWAPEIHKIKGKYYLLFNSRNETKQYSHDRGTCVAVSDYLKGPYRILTQEKPFSKGIDLSFFEDSDGKVYANWHEDNFIMCAEVDMKTMQPLNSYVALSPDSASWDVAGIEGSYMIKDDGTYYMFYSSWSRGYEIGYATSDSPMGPWKKADNNPIYGAQDKKYCERYGGIYTGNGNNPFGQIGHNSVFVGPNGNYWISCHGIIGNGDPMLIIEPFSIKDKKITIGEPSTDLKKIK